MNPLSHISYLIGIGVALSLAAWLYFGGVHHGEVKVEKADTKAVVVQEKHDATVDQNALIQLRVENERLNGLLAAKPLSIRVRVPASCPALDAAAGSGSQSAPSGGDATPVREGAGDTVDIGPGVQLLAAVGEGVGNQLRACQLDAAGKSSSR